MSINLTERAAQEIKKVMQEQNMDVSKHALRVGVVGGGCSGFSYQLEFIEKTDIDSLNDDQFEFHEIPTVVNRKCVPYLEGTTVDFHEDISQRGFKFENPNSKKSCGCGNSFSCG